MKESGVFYKKLPNPKFRLQIEECALCHGFVKSVVSDTDVYPNCSKLIGVTNDRWGRRICPRCKNNLTNGLGDYGFRLVPSMFTTPMDRRNTMILGLEQEFEGYFFGWLELAKIDNQTVYGGSRNRMFHLGYDTSIRVDPIDEFTTADYHNGQNELSWNCGSYSWWKYVSPLDDVCKVLKTYGGKEGESAGVHIHASYKLATPHQMESLARRCFNTLKIESIRNLILAVSGRTQERLDRWAFMTKRHPDSPEYRDGETATYSDHHACISFNRAGTVEFRCFSCSLDRNRILKRMKFVKEFVSMVNDKVNPVEMISKFSTGTKKFIKDEQELQIKANNMTEQQKVL